MSDNPHSAIRELERTRNLVIEADSLEELHRAVDQTMRQALACSKKNSAIRSAEEKYQETTLDELIETLANICIALLDSHDIPRERLLNLVDTALSQGNMSSACASH